MASKAKKVVGDPRRMRLEEVRAQQKAADRRRNFIVVGAFALVALVIIAVPSWFLFQKWQDSNRSVSEFGVSAAAANCSDVMDDEATGNNVHVGPGTDTPDMTHVDYTTNPPSSGSHFASSAGFARSFYTADDTPPVENLVHNLEHGATIVWYDDSVPADQVDELEALASRITADAPKFIVAAWDSSRGDFPEGDIALSHWSAAVPPSETGTGHRMYCDQVSGEAIDDFVTEFPYTDSPEPNAG